MLRILALLAALGLACAHGPSTRDRQTAEIHHDLGVEAFRGGRVQDALREFDEALRLDPTFSDAHRARGLVLEFGYGKLDEAAAEYRRAIQLRAGFSEAHDDLGRVLARQGRLEEAVREFDAALANMLYKEPWVARCNRGQVLWQLGRKEEGIAEMKACVASAPRYCHGYRELGRTYLADGRVPDAVESLERYARYCDKDPDAWYQLGLALLKSGDGDRAREAFRKCGALAGEGDLAGECRKSLEMLR